MRNKKQPKKPKPDKDEVFPKFYNTVKFQKLNQEWKKKLADSKFVDLEAHLKNEYSNLPRSGASHLTNADSLKFEYFRLAEHYLNDTKFKFPLHHLIWTKHVSGATTRNIAEQIGVSQTKVWYTINKIKKKMLEEYLNKIDEEQYIKNQEK